MATNFAEEALGLRAYYLFTPLFTLTTGPLIYFLFASLLHVQKPPLSKQLLHFLPVLVVLPFTTYAQQIIVIGTLSQLVYFVMSIRLVLMYQDASANIRSDVNDLDLAWIKSTLFSFMAFALSDLVRLNMQVYNDPDTKALWYFINLCWLLLLNFYLIVNVITQPKLVETLGEDESIQRLSEPSENPTEIFNIIHQTISDQYLYRQPRLTIHDVAEVIGLSTKDISWAINTCGGQNFNEYINRLRINEVKQQLKGGGKSATNVLTLAMNAGFNSKSSFNSVFKKQTGCTPSQFLKLK
ncbi:AraC family transcriptional regulator [Pseudoalteromonas sp. J010]|uniref:helix-turn-helix domain-containing protein n=1 Tax=Pseudoalteromonas sp. J010 TaxID=998465 RepID=UPI000F65219D|nr:AraC family transcriptional regulator [Pseudoalteromonas sp. J010]RRS07586.1 AraC family transcriptional regulator [Pseudoalteromonas sp. J010]